MATVPSELDTGPVTASLVLTVDVDAPVEQTWEGATDWAGQGQWMLGTTVWPTAQGGQGVGGGIEAFTGVGRLGFLDRMRSRSGSRPGAATCGTWAGSCAAPAPSRSSRAARAGRASSGARTSTCRSACSAGWAGRWSGRFFAYGVQRSLRRFARWVEDGRPAPRAA